MGHPHEVRASARIANSYEHVCDAWLKDPLGVLQRATSTRLSGLFGAKLHVPLGALEIGSEIVVDIDGVEHCRSADNKPWTKVTIEWGALRSPELFPTMHAAVFVYPTSETETALELLGTYEPPLGRIGEVMDAIAMRRVVKESVAHFLEDIARLLGARVSRGTAA